jgi:hypothetical protein
MARLDNEFLGGFSGRLGPAVGYGRLGRWYVRALPRQVANPRTEAQQEHRAMFKQEVQLAAQMRWAVNVGMKGVAHQMGLTAQNLFVKANQPAFGAAEGLLQVDYPALQVSLGPVAPVAITEWSVDEENILNVKFDKNPLQLSSANPYDNVYFWLWCPDSGEGYLTNTTYRRAKRMSTLLPQYLEGKELLLYAFVQDERGQCSPTAYGEQNEPEEVPEGRQPLAVGASPQTADATHPEPRKGGTDAIVISNVFP